MHGMGGQILPRGYLGITPPDVYCMHGLWGMDSTMEHARALSRADGKIDGSEIQVLKCIILSIGQMAWPWMSSSKFPKTRRISGIRTKFWGEKPESSGRHREYGSQQLGVYI